MNSPVELVNVALVGRLGFAAITSLADDNDRARAARSVYAVERDALLRCANWNFNQKRVALAQLTPDPAWGGLHSYQLPTDCLFVLETNLSDRTPWRIEGRTLVTREAAVSILYEGDGSNPAEWDANFTIALIDQLAFVMSYPLTRNATLADLLGRKAEATLKLAKSRDGAEGRPLKKFLSDALTRVR